MSLKNRHHAIALLAALLMPLLLGACATSGDYSPLLRAEPSIGSVQTRAPRTVRLFFAALPDVDRSNLVLTGPAGEYRLRGLHTMAADDLMIEILDPLTNGDYVVSWTTAVGDDPTLYTGSFGFSVSRPDS